eukprot:4059044-Alexandrium_andersonii.AAC.1
MEDWAPVQGHKKAWRDTGDSAEGTGDAHHQRQARNSRRPQGFLSEWGRSGCGKTNILSLIHISEPTRLALI